MHRDDYRDNFLFGIFGRINLFMASDRTPLNEFIDHGIGRCIPAISNITNEWLEKKLNGKYCKLSGQDE